MKGAVLILGIAVGILSFTAKSHAEVDSEIRSSIEDTLAVRHPNETGEWWRALGVNTPKIIISIFNADGNTYHQIRLVDALAWFDDTTTLEFLKEQAVHHPNGIVRRSAIRSIGLSQGIKEKEFLKQCLESSDPHTRLATAKLLNNLKEPAADQIVSQFLRTEKSEWISTAIRQPAVKKSARLVIEGKEGKGRN